MMENRQTHSIHTNDLCRIGIDDFISGKRLLCDLYIRFAEETFVKIAHRDEAISLERIKSYKQKGLKYLYIQHDDFRKYVHFNVSLAKSVQKTSALQQKKKMGLLRHTGDILLDIIYHDEIDQELINDSLAFVESAVDILSDESDLLDLLVDLNECPCSLYAHSIGVSFYSVLIAQTIGWNLPSNRFKVALGGLLHDIGEKEMTDILMRPRFKWSNTDVKLFETHSNRGIEILKSFPAIPDDVLQIVRDHHEDCLAHGFPRGLKKSSIHPMARLIAVADEFCYRVIGNANSPRLSPQEALTNMTFHCSERLDPEFHKALMRIFGFNPSSVTFQVEP